MIYSGMHVKLKNAFIYSSSTIKKPFKRESINLYIYDGKCLNGRYRVVEKRSHIYTRTVEQVYGYVNEEDLNEICG